MHADAVQQGAMESFLQHAGYLALIVFAFIEACSIPISSEITFGFAGVLAYQGHLNLALVIIIGTLAEFAGSSVSYGVGRVGGRRTVERLGRYVLVTQSDLDRVERFFAGRGSWTVAVGRALPLVRAFMGLGAGFVEVPAVPFALYNLLGTAVFATALSLIGYAAGSAFGSITHDLTLASYVLVAVVILGAAGIILLRLRELRKERASLGMHAGPPAAVTPAADDDDADPAVERARPGSHRRGSPPA
jgi:membrane protein DedA with SNARE-associated domain